MDMERVFSISMKTQTLDKLIEIVSQKHRPTYSGVCFNYSDLNWSNIEIVAYYCREKFLSLFDGSFPHGEDKYIIIRDRNYGKFNYDILFNIEKSLRLKPSRFIKINNFTMLCLPNKFWTKNILTFGVYAAICREVYRSNLNSLFKIGHFSDPIVQKYFFKILRNSDFFCQAFDCDGVNNFFYIADVLSEYIEDETSVYYLSRKYRQKIKSIV